MIVHNTVALVIVLLVLLWMGRDSIYLDTPIASDVDGMVYNVKREFDDYAGAADLLARLNTVNTTLLAHLRKKYARTPTESIMSWFSSNYRGGSTISEHVPRGPVNTSYVLNKGEAVKLCLRDKPTGQFHDFNTLVFVDLHEMSHLLDRKYGHGNSFWACFKFVLNEAVSIGLYTPIDYSKTPATYCGIKITSNPYFNNEPAVP